MIVMRRTEVRWTLAATLGLAVCLLAACGSGSPAAPTTPATSTVPEVLATRDATEDHARREVLAAYSGYLEAYIKASATADYRTKELARYVGEPLLGQLLNNLQNMSRSGVHNNGRPTWSPTVTELRLDNGEAMIQDCFDSTNWNAVGGRTQLTSQAKRYPVVVKAKRVSNRWYVYESAAQRGSTC